MALATFNVDFPLVKIEAPEEFQTVGRELASKQKEAAENGSQHATARKLGALFQHCLPRTPHLIKAYGSRSSEIALCSVVNPKPSEYHGVFAEYVGIDGTSLWAAATSGPEAISVHLLACLLTRMWTRSQALAIWVEMVSERKKDLETTVETDSLYQMSQHLSKISLTQDQLADWDASTRAWLQSADEAMGRKHVQLQQIINSVSIPVNNNPSLYKNVLQSWTQAMEAVNGLIQGQPQSVQSGSILLGLSSWHIYPDMIVLQELNGNPILIQQHDKLVDPGGALTVELQVEDGHQGSDGVCWSLSLGHLRYYGRSVASERRLDVANSRVTLLQLTLVAIGRVTESWGCSDRELAVFFLNLWKYLAPGLRMSLYGTLHWLGHLAQSMEPLLGDDPLIIKHCEQLLWLGRRRFREFVSLEDAIPPAFGLTSLDSIINYALLRNYNKTNVEICLKIIRQHFQSTQDRYKRGYIIRYRTFERGFNSFTYATAMPLHVGNLGQYSCDDGTMLHHHQRWAEIPSTDHKPRSSGLYRDDEDYNGPHKREERDESGESLTYYNPLEIQERQIPTQHRSRLNRIQSQMAFLRWTRPPELLSPYATKRPDAEPYVDLELLAGNPHQLALYMTESYIPMQGSVPEESTVVSLEIFYEALKRNFLHRESMIHVLNHVICSPDRRTFITSMKALATAREIYKFLPGATVDLGIAAKPLHELPWVRRHVDACGSYRFGLLPINRWDTFSCIACFESGKFSIEPSSLQDVIAITAGASIYTAAPLLCGPSVEPRDYEVWKIRGSIGKPGITLLIPPRDTLVRDDLATEPGTLVNHTPFDGILENSFGFTTLHLWFTEYTLPIDVGDHGAKNFEIYFLESVVSVYDKEKWIADINILDQLEAKGHIHRIFCGESCEHDRDVAFATPVHHNRLTAVDDWSELIDGPEFVGIVRSHGNWLGRLATATLSSQLGHETFIIHEKLCWSCFVTKWASLRPGVASGMNASAFHEMEAEGLLELMSGIVLIC